MLVDYLTLFFAAATFVFLVQKEYQESKNGKN
jgi:hypothetical protein